MGVIELDRRPVFGLRVAVSGGGVSERAEIRVAPIGSVVLPDDLVAPFGGDGCCGQFWFASIADIARAALGERLVAPCCGRRFSVRDLGKVAFFSRAAWDAAPDDEPPPSYYIGHAFRLPDRGGS